MLEILKEEGNGVLALLGIELYTGTWQNQSQEREICMPEKKPFFSARTVCPPLIFFIWMIFVSVWTLFCSCAYFLNCNHLQYLLFLFLFFFWTQLYFMYHHFRFVIYVLCFTFMFTDQILWSHWDVNFYKLSWLLRFRTFTALRRFRVSVHVYVHAEWRWSISGTCLS